MHERPALPADDKIDKRSLLVAALLVVSVFIVFAQVRDHQFTNYDDPVYITDNQHVQAGLTADGLRWAFTSFDFNWHPVTWISHMLDVELFGVNAGRHLLMNVVYHAISSVILFFVLLSLTHMLWRSAAVAALWAIHPLHVESVAWIAERKDVLSALFCFLTIAFYVRYVRNRSWIAYALMLVSLAFGLMSKGMLVTMPFVLLLLDYWPLDRLRAETWRAALVQNIAEKIPIFAMILGSAFMTFKAQREVSAVLALEALPPLARLANSILAYASYLGKTIWPSSLAIPYPYRVVISPTETVIAAVLLIAITIFVITQRDKRRYLFTGWFWFAGMLVPVIGLVQIGHQAMADRYTYLPHVGLFIAIVWLVADFAASRPQLRTAVAAASVVILVSLLVVARAQAAYWRDSITLFRHATILMPRNHIAHSNLGSAYLDKLQYVEAESAFRTSVRIFDRNALAHAGLGASLRKLGRLPAAERELRIAVAQDSKNDEILRQLGDVLIASGKREEALPLMQKALALRDDPRTRAELALARNDAAAAVASYEQAVRQDPESAELRNDFASALARQGRDQEALAQYQEALRIAPKQYDAHMNMGALLSRLERDAEAAAQFEAAAEERPSSPEPHVYLALINAKLGRFRQAEQEIETAMRIDEDAANTILTNAIRIPYKPTNIQEYLGFLKSQ